MEVNFHGKKLIFWRKIVIFHTKYPKNFRASLRSALFFKCAPPLTWNPGSTPGIHNQMCNQCLYITTNVVSSNPVNDDSVCYIQPVCDKVGQWLATGLWFSLGTPVSSTNKTDRHDITETLLKVALNTITNHPILTWLHVYFTLTLLHMFSYWWWFHSTFSIWTIISCSVIYKISSCCFSTYPTTLTSKIKFWLVQRQESVSEWTDMSVCLWAVVSVSHQLCKFTSACWSST
jgi:hypothetical protein